MNKLEGSKNTEVFVLDTPGAGGANHEYSISSIQEPSTVLGLIRFQNGPIKEAGVNGVTHEDLLAILIHRLEGFQAGPYACKENDLALMDVTHALEMLKVRTQKREERSVEGTSTI